jgi:hypothetical protein
MKIKEVYEIESGTRKRWYNYYSCDSCGVEYRKQKRLAAGSPREHYCSAKCYFDTVNPNNARVEVTCAHCGILFKKPKSKLPGSKSGLFFCCREHKDIAQSYIKEIMPDHYGTGSSDYRSIAFKAHGEYCAECGCSIFAVLEVHHKDKDRSNNDPSNLEVLCANCHTLEHKGLRTGVQR